MPGQLVPTKMCFTRGVGKHRHKLQSFEAALRDAGIAPFNLVKVSSIFPPHCKIVPKSKGLVELQPGGIVHCVMAEEHTNEPNRLVCAGIGLAVSSDKTHFGYIAEHHGYGLTKTKCVDLVEDMAASMLATTLGFDLDPDQAYDERREIYRSKGLVVRTRACVKTAEGDKNGLWTTVLAAAVFIY
ncbi:MAG: arginine decarboxylase, pyruvoyl-dependent [Phycisphaerae bacterium]|nr:arginine decarboxylase, pyruvoyl-dependent [Phycisphaerae bacterium]